MQPSKEAAIAADEAVRDLKEAKKDKNSGPARNTVIHAVLAKESTDQLKALLATDDQTLVRYIVTALADAFCLGDPRECLEYYDLRGWSSKKTAMPHVDQVRAWIASDLEDRCDA